MNHPSLDRHTTEKYGWIAIYFYNQRRSLSSMYKLLMIFLYFTGDFSVISRLRRDQGRAAAPKIPTDGPTRSGSSVAL